MDEFQDSYWHLALELIDEQRDKRLLLQLLRQNDELSQRMQSDYESGFYYTDEFTPAARRHLADLLRRHNLTLLPWGRRRMPAPDQSPWDQALDAIYANDDKQPLINLLESNSEVTLAELCNLADLLDQYDLKRRRGRQQPSYVFSKIEKVLFVAIGDVRARVRNGCKVKEAVAATALEWKLSEATLYNSYMGNRGGTRRAHKRAKK